MNNIILKNFLENLLQDLHMQKIDDDKILILNKFFLEFNTNKDICDIEEKDLHKYLVTGWYIQDMVSKKN